MSIHARPNYDILNCGATVVRGLGDPNQDPKEMVKHLLGKVNIRFTFYVMADCQTKKVTKNSSGAKLKKYIEENKLGEIIETPGRVFSDAHEKEGYIKMYVWRPDYAGKEFKEWCKKNEIVCIGRNVY